MVPLERGLIQGAVTVLISLTFQYASLSNVNSGIIASIFSVAVAFTCIIFYFLYDQKLTKYDMLGILLIITCVVMIGVGQNSDEPHGDIEASSLTIAIIFAVVTGLNFSISNWDIFVLTQKVGFPINQLAYDGNLILGFVYLPLFIQY